MAASLLSAQVWMQPLSGTGTGGQIYFATDHGLRSQK